MYQTCLHCRLLNILQFKRGRLIFRNYSKEKLKQANPVKYTSTVNLPKTTFPSRLSASRRVEVDQEIRKVTI